MLTIGNSRTFKPPYSKSTVFQGFQGPEKAVMNFKDLCMLYEPWFGFITTRRAVTYEYALSSYFQWAELANKMLFWVHCAYKQHISITMINFAYAMLEPTIHAGTSL